MLRETTKRREAEELKRALDEKPPVSAGVKDFNPDYVAPPLVNIQAQLQKGRRPMTSDLNRDLERENAQDMVEEIKAGFDNTIHRGAPGATAEAAETAMSETVRAIKVMWAKQAAVNPTSQPTPREVVQARDERAREESLALIKAEMMNTTHTEDYSGG